jgi:putative tryptophan/tyrosine transport system substrate-binding protein
MRRIGVLMNLSESDPEAQALVAAFIRELQQLGWSDGRNAHIDYRWSAGDIERVRRYAAELVALAPDVILAYAGSAVGPLQQATRTVPIVFAGAIDPVAAGLVASLARPGGNTTGFMQLEYSVSGKWLDLLKEIAPSVKRVAVLQNPTSPGAAGQLTVLHAAAPTFGVELSPLNARDSGDIERAVAEFALETDGGLIVALSPLAIVNRELIIALAARHRLPAVYPYRIFATSGGLICYGPVLVDPFRRAAGYVDRILKGEKPSDLPVQGPVKYETVLNLKTAKALGLDVPAQVLVRADEVIE